MFYDRSSFEVFMSPSPPLDLLRAVVHLVGGDTELPWAMKWRVALFYALCRLQRHVAIAPRLSLFEMKGAAPVPAPPAS